MLYTMVCGLRRVLWLDRSSQERRPPDPWEAHMSKAKKEPEEIAVEPDDLHLSDRVRKHASAAKRAIDQFDHCHVKCGFIGMSGVGKSSLINSIAGERIAKVGIVESTNEPQEFHHGGITFVDLPGCSTTSWPLESYVDRLQLKEFDFFVLVTAGRFFEDDLRLYEELAHTHKKPVFLARNKFDMDVRAAKREHGWTMQRAAEEIRNNLHDNLRKWGIDQPCELYLISALKPAAYDFPALRESLLGAVDGMKRMRLLADVSAWGEKEMAKKKVLADGRVKRYALASAASGLSPLPGTDVLIDAGLLVKMNHEILHVFGLTEKQAEYLGSFGANASAVAQHLVRDAGKLLSREAVTLSVRRLASGKSALAMAKYAGPVGYLVGATVSGTIGYAMTMRYGRSVTKECHRDACTLIEAVAKDVLRLDQEEDEED